VSGEPSSGGAVTPGAPHPFARFVAILGRGKSLTRSLNAAEAEEAMAMILAGQVLPEQLGAFLMLMRVKEETGEEIAGFAHAARASLTPPTPPPRVDLDWPSYAGKGRQPPWHLLAALLLARNGWRIFMHGFEGPSPGRLYSGAALGRLGVPTCENFEEAARGLETDGFAYLPIDRFAPTLDRLLRLRAILGLRSPIHTLSRTLNPFRARASLQAIFHPGYIAIHRDAAALTPGVRTLVFRGDGGENERRPNKPCEIVLVSDGVADEIRLPAISEARPSGADSSDIGRLQAVWRGDGRDAYGEAAIVGTLALALIAMGVEHDVPRAETRARDLWEGRDRFDLAPRVA
jgi:anthranilate phosphoribosyltransferase